MKGRIVKIFSILSLVTLLFSCEANEPNKISTEQSNSANSNLNKYIKNLKNATNPECETIDTDYDLKVSCFYTKGSTDDRIQVDCPYDTSAGTICRPYNKGNVTETDTN
jgi:hypothetical protein